MCIFWIVISYIYIDMVLFCPYLPGEGGWKNRTVFGRKFEPTAGEEASSYQHNLVLIIFKLLSKVPLSHAVALFCKINTLISSCCLLLHASTDLYVYKQGGPVLSPCLKQPQQYGSRLFQPKAKEFVLFFWMRGLACDQFTGFTNKWKVFIAFNTFWVPV